MRILVVNGPNLQLLGRREPSVYGTRTLPELQATLDERAKALGVALDFFTSNHEGELLDRLHAAIGDDEAQRADGVVINAGGLSHTSVALRDALAALADCSVPSVEVHLSNVYAREAFRATSLLAPVCLGTVSGLGELGYAAAVEALAARALR